MGELIKSMIIESEDYTIRDFEIWLNWSHPSLWAKFKNDTLSLKDFVFIAKKLEMTDEDILRIIHIGIDK